MFEGSDKFLDIGKLELQFGSVLYGEGTVLLKSNEIIVHPGAAMNLSAAGYSASEGPGGGVTTSSGVGTGGGYGAPGGSPDCTEGGEAHGLVRDPDEMGSGGANASSDGVGGKGGSFARFQVEIAITLEGERRLLNY